MQEGFFISIIMTSRKKARTMNIWNTIEMENEKLETGMRKIQNIFVKEKKTNEWLQQENKKLIKQYVQVIHMCILQIEESTKMNHIKI